MKRIVLLMFCFAILGHLFLGSAFAGKVPSQLVDALQQQIADLQQQTINLQQQINNIQLTPGPEGPQGPKGDQGDPGECDPTMINDLQNQVDALQAELNSLQSTAVISRFTDMGDGTVQDNKTGLIWLKDAWCIDVMNWDTAMLTAAYLADGQCGLTDASTAGDWRLPTKEEWASFVDPDYFNPPLCNAAGWGQWSEGDSFINVTKDGGFCAYWTSTTSENTPTYAWFGHMHDAEINSTAKSALFCFWPVRDAP